MDKTERYKIYQTKCSEYDLLVSREDYKNNILKIIQEIKPLNNSIVIDSGCGSGRLTYIAEPYSKYIYAFDFIKEMLIKAKEKSSPRCESKIIFASADHRNLPVKTGVADLLICGWSVCHLIKWNWKTWKNELKKTILEFQRTINSSGKIIIFETLGTGVKKPLPPGNELSEYYTELENEYCLKKDIIQTDYLFKDYAEFEFLTEFFFGKEALKNIVIEKNFRMEKNKIILPEFTGVWHL